MTSTRDELAEEVRDLGGRFTAAIADLHGLVINNCLSTETLVLDAIGFATRDWTVPFGSVAVHNGGAAALTVTNQTPASDPPVSGSGVAVIPTGAAMVVNLSGRVLSLYGTPGARVVLSVFTKSQPPAWAQLAVI